MREVVLIDSSVLCELLQVPKMCSRHAEVKAEFESLYRAGVTLTVPLAAVVETGNHVAQNGDGTQRRRTADRFATLVGRALRHELPLQLHGLETERLAALLSGYPDHAMRGVGLGDQTILDAWTEICDKLPRCRVRIWSLDADLSGRDRVP